MFINIEGLSIRLDPSIRHISKVACMAISGTIENGLLLTANPAANIVIYKDKIDFGPCINPELSSASGLIFPNFYKEYNSIVYRFGNNIKCSFWGKTLDYVGNFPPTSPDNVQLYNLIYPKFA